MSTTHCPKPHNTACLGATRIHFKKKGLLVPHVAICPRKEKANNNCRTTHIILIMLLDHNSLHFHKFKFLTHQSSYKTTNQAKSVPSLWLSLVFFRRGKMWTAFRSQAWPQNCQKAQCTAVLNIRLFLSYSRTGFPPTAYITHYTALIFRVL